MHYTNGPLRHVTAVLFNPYILEPVGPLQMMLDVIFNTLLLCFPTVNNDHSLFLMISEMHEDLINMPHSVFLMQAIEDRYLIYRPWLEFTLKVVDKIFTVIFILEMFIKQSAYGFKKYFTDAWCWLDFVIVAVSVFQSHQYCIMTFINYNTLRYLLHFGICE